MDILQLIAVGLATGLASSFLGVGGGFLMVPILYGIYPQLPPGTIIGTSLGVICLNSTINTYLFLKKKICPIRSIWLPLVPGLVIGAVSGSQLALLLPPLLIKQLFALALFLVVLRMIFSPKLATQSTGSLTPSAPPVWVTLFLGGISGLISGLTGLGGGIVLIPIFLFIYKLPGLQVPMYSNLLMIFTAGAGALRLLLATPLTEPLYPAFQIGQLNFVLISNILVGSIFSARFGLYIGLKTPEKVKRGLFITLLLLFALKILAF
ncbi:sulfite exporter TauE/SafE family protein [Bdellovibrionales bacterium]|nr:sulfite exporter TauE/SafE family protein [Bdellovibrionales bacterium]